MKEEKKRSFFLCFLFLSLHAYISVLFYTCEIPGFSTWNGKVNGEPEKSMSEIIYYDYYLQRHLKIRYDKDQQNW